MGAYLIRRVLLIFPTLFGIMLINFAVIQIVPGGPVEQMIAQMTGTAVESTARFSGGGEGELHSRFDASSFDDASKLVDDVISDFGKIDVLVNNAGIKKDNLLMRMDKEDFDSVINTNLSSVFNLTKSSIRTFLKQRTGSIINISSVVGVKGNAGQSNYSASKAGIIGFSKSVALELGSRNIRSNVIAPGFIETDMTDSLSEDVINSWKESIPLKRGGNPSDVGNACVFLASDLSSYITGQVLHVDGGMLT